MVGAVARRVSVRAQSANPAVPAAALPLIARWDKNGTMANDVKGLIQQLLGKFGRLDSAR